MKATITAAAALLTLALAASHSFAWERFPNYSPYLPTNPYLPANFSPVFKVPVGIAPDALGPGYYTMRPDGLVFGPNYCVYPPFPPFNGILPGPNGQPMSAACLPNMIFSGQGQGNGAAAIYPVNPYIRSPRDFYMWRETMEDRVTRELRPVLTP